MSKYIDLLAKLDKIERKISVISRETPVEISQMER